MDVNGFAVAHNIQPRLPEMELQDFCDFMWWWCTRNATDDKEVQKLKIQLWRPPPGEEVVHKNSPWSAENERKAFASFKAEVGR